MDEPHFRFELHPGHFVCLSPLNDDVLDELGVDGLGDGFGYFIYETAGGPEATHCINVLAKCPSFEAACRVLEIYRGPRAMLDA